MLSYDLLYSGLYHLTKFNKLKLPKIGFGNVNTAITSYYGLFAKLIHYKNVETIFMNQALMPNLAVPTPIPKPPPTPDPPPPPIPTEMIKNGASTRKSVIRR